MSLSTIASRSNRRQARTHGKTRMLAEPDLFGTATVADAEAELPVSFHRDVGPSLRRATYAVLSETSPRFIVRDDVMALASGLAPCTTPIQDHVFSVLLKSREVRKSPLPDGMTEVNLEWISLRLMVPGCYVSACIVEAITAFFRDDPGVFRYIDPAKIPVRFLVFFDEVMHTALSCTPGVMRPNKWPDAARALAMSSDTDCNNRYTLEHRICIQELAQDDCMYVAGSGTETHRRLLDLYQITDLIRV